MRATYFISFNGVNYSQFYPTNEPVISWAQEGDEIFKRARIDLFRIGKTKNATVYSTIVTRFLDPAYFASYVYYQVKILGVTKYYYFSPLTDGGLDKQNGVYEAHPEPNDNYKPILDLYQRKYRDINGYIFGNRRGLMIPVNQSTSFSNVSFTTFTVTGGNNYFWLHNGGGTARARSLLSVSVAAGWGVIVTVTSFTGNTLYLQLVNNSYANNSNVVTVNGNGKYVLIVNTYPGGNSYLEAYDSAGGGASGQLTIDLNIYDPSASSDGGDSLYNALNSVINGASYINAGLNIVSTFLWNDPLPTGHAVDTPNISAYITAHPTYDYVIQDAPNWNHIYITPADVFTTAKLTEYNTSLQDVMMILKYKLHAWWFIDPDGKFRIEHDKYFRDFVPQADLTSVTYVKDKPEIDAKVYTFSKGDLSNQINYSENNDNNSPDWVHYPIIFDPLKTSPNVKDITISNLSTDLGWITTHPGDANNAGLILLKTTYNNTLYYIDVDKSPSSSSRYINAHMSWNYLMANYYDYFADAISGTINNGTAHTFLKVKEVLKQSKISFYMSTDFDWKKPFTLVNGTGWTDSVDLKPESGFYSINVGYDPYE